MVHGGFITATVDDAATGGKKWVLLCQALVAASRDPVGASDAPAAALHATLEAVERGDLSAMQGFCGACFDTPEAARVRERLRDALAALPEASAGVLHHALPREHFGDLPEEDGLQGNLLLRRVCAWGEADVEAATLPAGADAFETDDPDEAATLLLLTHRFELPAERSADGAERRRSGTLTIQTLAEVTDPSVSEAEDGLATPPDARSMRVVFGHAPLTLQRGGFATCVRLNGRLLRADEAAAASLRSAIHSRVRAQLLLALRDCVEHRWAGGYLSLRGAAVALLGADAPRWLEPLAQQLLRVRLRTCSPLLASAHLPAVLLLNSCTWEAEAAEACGDFAAAAALYKAACDNEADMRAYFTCGSRHAAAAQPLGWSRYGKACTAAGRFAEAEAALEAGLQRLGGLHTAEDRLSARIELLHSLLHLHRTTGAHESHTAACRRLFADQVAVVTAAEVAAGAPPPGTAAVSWDTAARNYCCVGPVSGRRFFVTQRQGQHYGTAVPQGVMHYIVEVPRGEAPPAPHPDAFVERTELPFRANAAQHALPRVPRAVCAACGAPGDGRLQRCAACMGIAYCSKACQLAHWGAHKAACKAARKAAAAGAGGAGASGAA
jgi:hypothetical protein